MNVCRHGLYPYFRFYTDGRKWNTSLIRFIVLTISACSFHSLANVAITSSPQSKDIIEFNFLVDKFSLNEMVIGNLPYTTVECEAAVYTNTKGLPSLPFFNANFIIPKDTRMEYEVLDSTIEEIKTNKIIPSKGSISRKINPETVPYTFDNFYTTDSWYPSEKLVLSTPYIIHTVRGITLTIHPFQYNPTTGILRVTRSMKVRLTPSGIDSKNSNSISSSTLPPAFEGLCKKQFDNYSQPSSVPSRFDDGDKMIVIAAAALADPVRPLIEWKNQKGIKTELFVYPDQTGGEGVDKLKQFLQSTFNTAPFSYILFVGDLVDIPTYTRDLLDENMLQDITYARLNGDDDFPDALVGRFSSSKAEDIDAMVRKTIQYEKYPAGDWYQKSTGIASDLAQDRYKDSYYMENFRKKLLEYGYTAVDQIYDPKASKDNLISAMNEGRGWINYMGHGITESWITTGFSTDDVSRLLSLNKPAIIMSAACLGGNFTRHCLAEALTTTPNKGAVVCAAPTFSVDWVNPQLVMKEIMEYLLVNDKCLSVGALFYNGILKMLRSGINDPSKRAVFNAWTLFGDPSLMPFTKPPQSLSVSYPLSISKNEQAITITCNDSITGRICLYNPKKGILGSKLLTAKSTTVSFPLDAIDAIDSIILTVTAFNRIPLTKIIPVTEPQSITFISPELSSRFYTGQEMLIEWVCSDTTANAVNIDFSFDNGTTFTAIAKEVRARGEYRWMIPDVTKSDRCCIKISDVRNSHSSVSPPFTISPKASISLSQSSFDVHLSRDTTATLSFEINNKGNTDLHYSLLTTIRPGFEQNNCLLNEVMTSDSHPKYVEIFNDGKAVDLTGWKLKWKNNDSDLDSVQFPANFILEHNSLCTYTNDSSLVNGTTRLFAKNFTLSNSNPLRIGLYDKFNIPQDIIFTESYNVNKDYAAASSYLKFPQLLPYKNPVIYRERTEIKSSGENWKSGASGSFDGINPGEVVQIDWLSVSFSPDSVTAQNKKTVSLKIATAGLTDSVYFDTVVICHNAPDTSTRLFIPVKLIVGISTNAITPTVIPNSGFVSMVNTGTMLQFRFTENKLTKKEVSIYDLSGRLLHFQAGTLLRPWYFQDSRRRIPNGHYFVVIKMYEKERVIFKKAYPMCLLQRY